MKESTAYHEAGHAAAHVVLGVSIKSVSIAGGDTFLGLTVSTDEWVEQVFDAVTQCSDDSDEAEEIIRKEVVCLYAGPIAEVKYAGGDLDDALGSDSEGTDRHRLVDFAMGFGPKSTFINDCKAEAHLLIDEQWPMVEAIAKSLLENAEISGDEVLSICQRPYARRGGTIIGPVVSLDHWDCGRSQGSVINTTAQSYFLYRSVCEPHRCPVCVVF